jgi:hypothetical protein
MRELLTILAKLEKNGWGDKEVTVSYLRSLVQMACVEKERRDERRERELERLSGIASDPNA